MSTRKTSKSLSGKKLKSLSSRKSLSQQRPKSEPILRRSRKPLPVKRPHSEPISFKIPKAIYAPKNIKHVVDNIQDSLDKLSQIGKEKGAVHYTGNMYIGELAYIAVINKFGNQCMPSYYVDGIQTILTINSNKAKTPMFNDPYALMEFGESLQDCIKSKVPIICIYLRLRFDDGPTGHANLLIYRPFKRKIERFDPHGKGYYNDLEQDFNINRQLKELFEVKLNNYTNGVVIYKPPVEICPYTYGFQLLEQSIKGSNIEGGGFCTMWSLFVMEMILNNPSKTTAQIIEKVMEITQEDPQFLKDVIRGYVVGVEQLLDETFKMIDKTKFSFETTRFDRNDNLIYEFIFNSIDKTKTYLGEYATYNSSPKSVKIDLFDKLMEMNLEQLKKINKKLNLVGTIIRDKKRLVMHIMVNNKSKNIEQAIDELLSQEEKRLSN